ncbi:hypothetical protein ACKI16_29325 [Streptomyces scabiei]
MSEQVSTVLDVGVRTRPVERPDGIRTVSGRLVRRDRAEAGA